MDTFIFNNTKHSEKIHNKIGLLFHIFRHM